MQTSLLVAHGMALDTARVKGKTVLLFRRESETPNEFIVDTGMVVGHDSPPTNCEVYARYVPHEACKHMVRINCVLKSRLVGLLALHRESQEYKQSLTLWQLPDDKGYFVCHYSIDLSQHINGAVRLEDVYHVT